MEKGDKAQAQLHLSKLKDLGVVQFDRVLAIAAEDRIPAIASTDDGYLRVSAVLTASIKSAMENMNLKFPMSEDQIVELAGLVIDQSAEDNLSLEDVLLFLQDLVSGKAGKIFDRMDIPRFFELFETYRQERHTKLLEIRYEQHVQFNGHGDRTRISENDSEKENMRIAMGDYLKQKYSDDEKQQP